MRFKKYIKENLMVRKYDEKRIKVLDKKEALRFLLKNCEKSLKSTPIWRGRKGNENFCFVDPREGELRKSANTLNYITLIMDNLPSWNEYPKRSHSLICATDTDSAKNFGRLYRVIPYNSAMIGICRRFDLWWSFKTIKDVMLFNRAIDQFSKKYNIPIDENNWKIFLKDMKKVEIEIRKDKNAYLDNSRLVGNALNIWFKSVKRRKEKKGNPEFFDIMNEQLDPKKNGFTLKKAGSHLPDKREVWVGNAPCIYVKKDVMDELEAKGTL